MSDRNFFLAAFGFWLVVVTVLVTVGSIGEGEVGRDYYTYGLLGSLLSLAIATAIGYPINRFLRNHNIKLKRKGKQDQS